MRTIFLYCWAYDEPVVDDRVVDHLFGLCKLYMRVCLIILVVFVNFSERLSSALTLDSIEVTQCSMTLSR